MNSDNPYEAYFVNQAKGKGYSQLGGYLPGFQGARMRRGFGLGKMGSGQSWKRKRVIKDSDHIRSKKRRISNKTKGIKGVLALKVIQPQSEADNMAPRSVQVVDHVAENSSKCFLQSSETHTL